MIPVLMRLFLNSASEHTIVGERDVGDARLNYMEIYLKWFDYWLKGIDNGITKMPKVQYYTMGLNKWQSSDVWPLPETQYTKYYFHSRGQANSRNGDGWLSTRPPKNEPSDSFIYDPGHPVPSVGGQRGTPYGTPAGAVDQARVEIRNDVLVYTTHQPRILILRLNWWMSIPMEQLTISSRVFYEHDIEKDLLKKFG